MGTNKFIVLETTDTGVLVTEEYSINIKSFNETISSKGGSIRYRLWLSEIYYEQLKQRILYAFKDDDKERFQTLQEDEIVKFDNKDMAADAGDYEEEFLHYHGQRAKILCLATYTQLGDKDYEYYDIVFDDGYVMYAISGYHLTLITS